MIRSHVTEQTEFGRCNECLCERYTRLAACCSLDTVQSSREYIRRRPCRSCEKLASAESLGHHHDSFPRNSSSCATLKLLEMYSYKYRTISNERR
jgi:hypothetical protein